MQRDASAPFLGRVGWRRRRGWLVGGLVLLAVLAAGAPEAVHWGREYWYGTDQAIVRQPNGPFVTPKKAAHATVWAVGDGADGGSEAKALAARIARARPSLFLYLGDVYQRGTGSEFRDHYATVYGVLAPRTAPTPGNHDWGHHTEGYDPYWKGVTGKSPPAYYSFTLAGWQFLSLNSEAPLGPGSAQLAWLERQVRGRGTCRIAFWHRPRFSAGAHGDQEDVAPLWDALHGHAALVLNGHDHDMQRLRPRDGMLELVSGAGGKSHYGVDRGYSGLAFSNDTDNGAVRLALRAGQAAWSFVTADGRTLDSGSIRCRRR